MNRRDAILGMACGVAALSGRASVDGAQEDSRRAIVDEFIKVRQAQRFTQESVPEEDIQSIVTAGLNAPSAKNVQPWFFAVVTDKDLLKEIDKAANVNPNGRLSVGGSPLVVFVSTNGSEYGLFDGGVATDRMNVAANLLGYGCKTVATAAKAANEPEFKKKLHIPDNYTVFAALLIGKEIEKSVDGVSGATTRAPQQEKVFFYKK